LGVGSEGTKHRAPASAISDQPSAINHHLQGRL